MGSRNRNSFNKRFKELQKKKKAEDKRERKLARKLANAGGVDATPSEEPEDQGEIEVTSPDDNRDDLAHHSGAVRVLGSLTQAPEATDD